MHGLYSENWCGEDGPHDRRRSQLIMGGAMFANRAELPNDYANDRRQLGARNHIATSPAHPAAARLAAVLPAN